MVRDGQCSLPANCDPYDLIVTPEGTLLVSDITNDKFIELDENGSHNLSFGSAGSGDGQFNNPIEIAIGPEIKFFVADSTTASKFLREMVLSLKHLGSIVLVIASSINLRVLVFECWVFVSGW